MLLTAMERSAVRRHDADNVQSPENGGWPRLTRDRIRDAAREVQAASPPPNAPRADVERAASLVALADRLKLSPDELVTLLQDPKQTADALLTRALQTPGRPARGACGAKPAPGRRGEDRRG